MNCTTRCGTEFFDGSPDQLAQRLLGHTLVRNWKGQRLSGVIIEVEAYLATGDAASHSFTGVRKRNASMFEPAGTLYVYTIHQQYCLNVASDRKGIGSAVLIRALEPLEGLDEMIRLRGLQKSTDKQLRLGWLRTLLTGPGRLCQGLSVDLALDGVNLAESPEIWVEPPGTNVTTKSWRIENGPRIGISKATELHLRWFMDGHQLVSGAAADHKAGRYWRFVDSYDAT